MIEIIWAIMGAKVDKRVPKTASELKMILYEVWNSIEIETINSLIRSIKPRLRKLLLNQERQVHKYDRIDRKTNEQSIVHSSTTTGN